MDQRGRLDELAALIDRVVKAQDRYRKAAEADADTRAKELRAKIFVHFTSADFADAILELGLAQKALARAVVLDHSRAAA